MFLAAPQADLEDRVRHDVRCNMRVGYRVSMRCLWSGVLLGVCLLLAGAGRLEALERQVVQNFDDQEDGLPPTGWKIGNQAGLLGDWQVQAGELVIEGAGAGTGGGGREVWIWYDRTFSGDITVEWRMQWVGNPGGDVGRHGGMALFAKFPGELGSRYAGMSGYTIDWIDRASDHGVRCHKWTNGGETGLLPDGLFTEPDPPEVWRVEIRGDVMTIFLDDQLFQEITDFDYRDGYIGFYQWENNVNVHYDDLVVTNPDFVAKRDLPDGLTNGTSGTAKLSLLPYLPGTVTVKETLPAGLVPSNPSNGGVVNGQSIDWNLGNLTDQLDITYTITAQPEAIDSVLDGSATHNAVPYAIAGDTTYTGSPFTPLGFIKLWNHLGPLAFVNPSVVGDHGSPGACDANGGPDLILDWIVNADGSVTEETVSPFPGLVTRPSYGGDGQPGGTGARAAGLVVGPGDVGLVVDDRAPVWKAGLSPGDTIDHASPAVHGFDAEDHVTLSSVWLTNTTGAPIDTSIGFGSDDSIQIFLNGEDVTAGGIIACRGWGAANEEQNVLPVSLPAGESRLLLKITDGCCGSGFRLRFQDPNDPLGPGLLPPDLLVSLESAASPPPGSASRQISPDTFNQGDLLTVTIDVTARTAGANVRVVEVLPADASAQEISDGGTLLNGEITWNLTSVSTKSVTYKLLPAACQTRPTFGQSTWTIGNIEAVIQGEQSATRAPLTEGTFANWTSSEIGTTGGAARPLGDHSLVVSGTGAGIKVREDQFHFVSAPLTGDASLTARIDCFDDPSGVGLVGLMVRDTLDTFGGNIFFALSSGDLATTGLMRLVASTRRETSATRISTQLNLVADQRDVTGLPLWLRIRRGEGKIFLERSGDGVTFTQAATRDIGTGNTQINLRDEALYGLAATGNGGSGVSATFTEVSGPAFTGSAKPKFHRGDSDQNGQLQLTDAVRILGYLFLGAAAPTCFDAADADDNGQVQLTDAVRILNYLFIGGAPPAPPGPPDQPCGEDAALEDPDLGCEEYTSC